MKLIRIFLFVVIICLAINAFAEPNVHLICESKPGGIEVCHEITDFQAMQAGVNNV